MCLKYRNPFCFGFTVPCKIAISFIIIGRTAPKGSKRNRYKKCTCLFFEMGKSGHSSFQFILGLGQLQLVMLDALFTVCDVLGGSGKFLLQFSDSVVLFCVAVFTLFHFQGADLTQLFQELLFLIFEFFDDLGHFFLLFFFFSSLRTIAFDSAPRKDFST